MDRDEFSYMFKRNNITLTRNDGPLGNWYIRVTAPDGCYVYDGWWADSAGKPLKDALYEAKVGAMLIPKSPSMDPQRNREIAAAASSVGGIPDGTQKHAKQGGLAVQQEPKNV